MMEEELSASRAETIAVIFWTRIWLYSASVLKKIDIKFEIDIMDCLAEKISRKTVSRIVLGKQLRLIKT